jgi:hypothetical protein
VNELQKVASWEDLGQWCWERMLDLERSWQIELPFRGDLPSPERERSIDCSMRSMLRDSADFPETPEEDKPWILARFQFASGLLQPCNLELLRMPDLFDPAEGLQFFLLEEWYGSGREFWPLVCRAITEPDRAECCKASSLHKEASRVAVAADGASQ